MSQTLDGMSVTELEALKARVEATLKEQREKEANAGWDIEPGHVKIVDGEWRGVGMGRCGNLVRFEVRGGKVLYCWPHIHTAMWSFQSDFIEVEDSINSGSCHRVIALLALKALGQ